MSKKIISKQDLQSYLTKQIQSIQGCKACSFGGITELSELDKDGCNWSESISINSAQVSKDLYLPAALTVILEARKLFNIRT